MRKIKLIIGVACLLAAVSTGGLLVSLVWEVCGSSFDAGLWGAIPIGSILVILTSGLAAGGGLLIKQRQSRISLGVAIFVASVWVCTVMSGIAFVRARNTSSANACINNLRQIDGAKQQWALEHNATTNSCPTWNDIRIYCGRSPEGVTLTCPQGGTYTIGRVDEPPRCSIGTGTHVLP